MDPNAKLLPSQGKPLSDLEKYRILVRKLNYLNFPCVDHWNVVIHVLKYIKGSFGKHLLYGYNNHSKVICCSDADWAGSLSDKRSTSGYFVLIGDNLISWKSKKQHVVVRSSTEVEYKAMASATYELIWLKHLLKEYNLERPLK